jgi:hypothetical protein
MEEINKSISCSEIQETKEILSISPNPFNPTTTLQYHLTVPSYVFLGIYDIVGKNIGVLVQESQAEGIYRYHFNAAQLSSGIYFARLIVRQDYNQPIVVTKKMLLAK